MAIVPPGGKHLLLDIFSCHDGLTMDVIEKTLTDACIATGATVLFHHSHLFDDGGCSGVVVLAESHASFHYWWEEKYMAVDIFVCGECDPYRAIPILQKSFQPNNIDIHEIKRGLIGNSNG